MLAEKLCGLALAALLLTAAAPAPRELELIDAPRGRAVPVAIYGAAPGRPKPLALISHGYGGTNRAYSFIAEALAARGFVVASVQHELWRRSGR